MVGQEIYTQTYDEEVKMMKKFRKWITTLITAGILLSLAGTTIQAESEIFKQKWTPVAEGALPYSLKEASDKNERLYYKGKLYLTIKDKQLAVRQFEEKKEIMKLKLVLEDDKLLLPSLTGTNYKKLEEKIALMNTNISKYYSHETAFQKVISAEKEILIQPTIGEAEKMYFSYVYYEEEKFTDIIQAIELISQDSNISEARPLDVSLECRWIPVTKEDAELITYEKRLESWDRNEDFYYKNELRIDVVDRNQAITQYEEKETILKKEIKLEEDKLLLPQLSGIEYKNLVSEIEKAETLISEYYENETAFQKVISIEQPMGFKNPPVKYWGNTYYQHTICYDETKFTDVMQAVRLISEDENIFIALPSQIALVAAIGPIDSARDFMIRLYRTILDRIPDDEGLDYWVTNIKNPEKSEFSAGFVVLAFFQNEEYLSRNTSNEDFIEDAYETMLDRKPDEEGFTFWKSQLIEGVSRQSILEFFIQSEEFSHLSTDYGFEL